MKTPKTFTNRDIEREADKLAKEWNNLPAKKWKYSYEAFTNMRFTCQCGAAFMGITGLISHVAEEHVK